MQIQKNYPLQKLTAMRIGGPAKYFAEAKSARDVKEAVAWAKEKGEPLFVLAGGNNILVSDRGFQGLVILVKIAGFERVEESNEKVILKIGAGEIWDSVVARAVKHSWWGIENMTAIPGRAGGFVAQNAGAYGCETAEVTEKVEVYDRHKDEVKLLNKNECAFGYRQSIFKNAEKRYIILNVFIQLQKKGEPKIGYPDVAEYFKARKIGRPKIAQVRRAVEFIRGKKLPATDKIGSAGSFFKNIILKKDEYGRLVKKVKDNFGKEHIIKLEELKNKFSKNSEIKIQSAYVLDLCGLKGYERGGARIWDSQPLIIINASGKAKATDVLNMFSYVRKEVYKKTGVKLESEVEFVGFQPRELGEYFKLTKYK